LKLTDIFSSQQDIFTTLEKSSIIQEIGEADFKFAEKFLKALIC
jgi:hypothetical protein